MAKARELRKRWDWELEVDAPLNRSMRRKSERRCQWKQGGTMS